MGCQRTPRHRKGACSQCKQCVSCPEPEHCSNHSREDTSPNNKRKRKFSPGHVVKGRDYFGCYDFDRSAQSTYPSNKDKILELFEVLKLPKDGDAITKMP